MNKNLTPIETIYKGYKFRSRLEARLAVFFDAQGIKWEYEKEGYNLDGLWYLPDFWLPQVNMWAEVKPDTISEADLIKCKALAGASGKPCLLLEGVPDYKEYDSVEIWHWDENDPLYGTVQRGSVTGSTYALVTRYLNSEHRFPANCYCENGVPDSFGDDYIEAVNAARQARFENR